MEIHIMSEFYLLSYFKGVHYEQIKLLNWNQYEGGNLLKIKTTELDFQNYHSEWVHSGY